MIDDSFGNYIAGLTDGEGCFALHYGKHSRNNCQNVTVGFVISLRSDDKEILYEIQKVLQCGYVRQTKVYRNDKSRHSFHVTKISELTEVIVPFFEKYKLRAKKRKDFEIWKEAVLCLGEIQKRKRTRFGKAHGTSRWNEVDRDFISHLSKQLKDVRIYR